MTKQNRFFEDIAKLASSASGTFVEMKNEMESLVNTQIEKFLRRSNFVSREDFDAVRDIALKARAEQEKLEKRIADLEKQLARKAPKVPPAVKLAPTPKGTKPRSKPTV